MDAKVIATFSNANGDGRVYPDTFEVHETDTTFDVWDITGWTGFETCESYLIASFPIIGHNYPARSRAMALDCARFQSVWSDPQPVFDAAIGLLKNEKGAFKNLKYAVDWRDKA